MRAAEVEIRACVGLLKKELMLMVEQAIKEEVADALEAAVEAERIEIEQANADKQAQTDESDGDADDSGFTFKLDVAGAKAELAELGLREASGNGRRRENGSRRRRASSSLISGHLEQGIEALGDGNSAAGQGSGASKEAEASPEPLFVHKRRRDGQIQSLTRVAPETAP